MTVVVRRAILVEDVVHGKRLGRHVEHDPRSRQFPAHEARSTPTSPVVHARRIGPLDQGQLGSCTGNAVAGALATSPLHAPVGTVVDEALAVKLYELATTLDGYPGAYPPDDTGSSGLAACKAAKRLGLLAGYRHAFGVDHAVRALALGPCVTGVDWYEGFDRPNADGLVEISGGVRGGHEFEAAELYPDQHDPLASLVGFWNSWGTGYAKGGRFFMTVRTWGDLLERGGDVTVPSRRAVTPAEPGA